ncbi:MAG: tRNA (guanosine(46)-N7)-methyltransferase TrmB [Tenericutes bacterium]|nr:tRNA (guanosine(46)-N7)-methyltransferase TrmB [Mycoplasmatota bacterium]
MRLRNVKNKEEILNGSKYLIKNPEEYIGKWDQLFEKKQPIYIEIGMGKGKFLIENAIKYPDINFIGIEKYDSVVAKSLPKIPECLTNIVVIRIDALNIDKVFDKEIERIYLNFSDPWPKVRHSMRRLSSRVFLEKYDKIFKGEKNIYLRTDNRDLFTFSLESFSQYGYVLHDINLNLHEIDQPDIITTEYEDKFVEAGLPIYQVVAIKE